MTSAGLGKRMFAFFGEEMSPLWDCMWLFGKIRPGHCMSTAMVDYLAIGWTPIGESPFHLKRLC
jgi:hypothetical protein